MTKLTLIEEATRTLNRAKTAFDQARGEVSGEMLDINSAPARPFNQCTLWNDVYYAMPNANQVAGYTAKVAKFIAKYPSESAKLPALVQTVEEAAKAVAAAKQALADTQAKVKADRAAKLADKGDQNLIAALAGPRGEYRVRCVEHLTESVGAVETKLAEHGYDISAAYPYPDRKTSRFQAVMQTEARKFAEMFYRKAEGNYSYTSGPYIVVRRDDNKAVISSLADKLVAQHFDGYIYKLSKKIGKPVATATHRGSIWTDCALVVTCQDGESQTWTTKCIWNRSVLGKVFNQWPTRRKS